MFKTFIVATAALGFSLIAGQASAGKTNTTDEAAKPGQSLIHGGGGCYEEYPVPQSAKPSA
jgi:hypothetical protein